MQSNDKRKPAASTSGCEWVISPGSLNAYTYLGVTIDEHLLKAKP